MKSLLSHGVNMLSLIYLFLFSILFEFFIYWYLGFLGLGRRMKFDDLMRIHNQLYGRFIIRILWPVVKLEKSGEENLPCCGPCMLVANHRSFCDIIFSAFIPIKNVVVFIRSWPFRLRIFGWYMRKAKYMDIESTTFPEALEKVHGFFKRNLSFLFFPEGHRSPDGKLQPFHSGAFILAARFNMPVVPVCMKGTEKITLKKAPFIRPAKVHIHFLPPIHPSSFDEENRAYKLKKKAEQAFREYLGE